MASVAPAVDMSVVIAAPPEVLMKAFFDPDALGAWWGIARSVTTPRVLGPYVIEWPATDFTDEILGRLGGVFRGIVMHYDPAHGFFVADAFWLPPDGDPIGPMALEVTLEPSGVGTRVRVSQRGFQESPRWRRYYEVVGIGWDRALASLKRLVETEAEG